MKVNRDRLEKNLIELSKIGKNENGGIDRSFGSDTDIEARKWIKSLWENEAHLKVRIDAIANMWGEDGKESDLPPIVVGSHHDAVTNGGMYDGALGVLLATEVMQTIKENNYKLRHPLNIVSFSAEEPNSFNISTLGSKTVSGTLTKEKLEKIRDEINNVELKDAVKLLGGDIDKVDEILIKDNDIAAFLECHVEQGRNLIERNLSLGVVTKITGIYREEVKVIGEANHAGTTLMRYRHDAVLAASEVALALEASVKEIKRDDVVGTVGYMNVLPNAASIIAGEVSLIVEIRSTDSNRVKEVLCKFAPRVNEIMKRRGVEIARKTILDQKEVSMDETVINSLKKAAKAIDEPFMELPSMAGHDAAHIAKVARAGMLFVPSIGGKSHCPDEKTNIEDIEKAGNEFVQAVLILDKELN